MIKQALDGEVVRAHGGALKALRRCLFFISAPMVFITFALPLRAEDLGGTAIQIGVLYSIFTISVFVIQHP